MISEISLKGRADSTEACTLNATRVEDKVSRIKHIIIGKKQWTRDIEAKGEKSTGFQYKGTFQTQGQEVRVGVSTEALEVPNF